MKDHITLPSGKIVKGEAGGFIGINAEGEISEGHDSELYNAFAVCPEDYAGIEECWKSWRSEDKLALADIMIKRWEDYRQAVAYKGKFRE